MPRRFTPLAFVLVGLAAPSAAAQAPAPARAPADRPDGPPVVTAKAWVVVDGKTGAVLGGSDAAAPLAIASTTKIMTAQVVLGLAADDPKVLDEVVTFSERAAKTGGTSSGLKAGDRLPARDLLYGLLLPSGNDAAVALAEHFGRRFPAGEKADEPEARFVAEMNRRATALKLGETKYLDPHGLGLNKSSARDLAALARDALADPRFAGYAKTRRHTCDVTGPDGARREVTWTNTNRLLGIDGYDGVKTGTTTAAGYCLVGSGRRGPEHLIVVVLGSTSNDSRYADARNLFRWAWRERDAARSGGGK